MLHSLPQEILLHVFSFLDPKSVCQVGQVCRVAACIAADNALWRTLYTQHHVMEEPLSVQVGKRCISWKTMFVRRACNENAWRKRRHHIFSLNKYLPRPSAAHTLYFHDTVLAIPCHNGARTLFVNNDTFIILWDLSASEDWQQNVLNSRIAEICVTGDVYSVVMAPTATASVFDTTKTQLVAAGSRDQSISLWKVSWQTSPNSAYPIADASMTTVGKLCGHTDAVWKLLLHLPENVLFSASHDGTAKMWDVSTLQCCFVHAGHTDRVAALRFDSDRRLLVTGGWDSVVCILDLRSMKVVERFTMENNVPTRAVWCDSADSALFVGSDNHHIAWFDMRRFPRWTGASVAQSNDYQPAGRLHGHQETVWVLQGDASKLVSGSWDRSIRVWCRRTYELVEELHLHKRWVWWLQYDSVSPTALERGDAMVSASIYDVVVVQNY